MVGLIPIFCDVLLQIVSCIFSSAAKFAGRKNPCRQICRSVNCPIAVTLPRSIKKTFDELIKRTISTLSTPTSLGNQRFCSLRSVPNSFNYFDNVGIQNFGATEPKSCKFNLEQKSGLFLRTITAYVGRYQPAPKSVSLIGDGSEVSFNRFRREAVVVRVGEMSVQDD
jgi:hypothetical protein